MEQYDSKPELLFGKNNDADVAYELEELCKLVKSSITNGLFVLSEQKLKQLEQEIDETLKWLENTFCPEYDKCMEKIDTINQLCEMISVFGTENDGNENNKIVESIDDEIGGTSILNIRKIKNVDASDTIETELYNNECKQEIFCQ